MSPPLYFVFESERLEERNEDLEIDDSKSLSEMK